jgi:ABC-type multidrug transport system fused ATPase/permease subunit
MFYTFEIVMAMEFSGRDFPCASDAIIPSGAKYNDTAFQTCSYKGMAAGQFSLNGDEYIENLFGLNIDNVGRDFGILIVMIVGFLLINIWLVENIDWASGSRGALELAKDNVKLTSRKRAHDEESAQREEAPISLESSTGPGATENAGIRSTAKSQTIFTWRKLNYTISHKQGDKQLLREVSGYSEPGRLTALVGASGAGKSTCKSIASTATVSLESLV